jgi:hypothetical protein
VLSDLLGLSEEIGRICVAEKELFMLIKLKEIINVKVKKTKLFIKIF